MTNRFSLFIAVLMGCVLLTALGTGLGMRSLGIWAFHVHRAAGFSAVILGMIITALWSIKALKHPI
ncbi:MAG TPA: hypothetical protein VN426_04170 [Syntrophomonadaceae bacterium]|nr:hypothetical protein [Syntrophomonadaceae bacterium]